MDIAEDAAGSGSSGRVLVLLLVVVGLLVAAYFALGMPGMDHSPSSPPAGHEKMDM